MATHSSILAWKIHGQRRLAGFSPWGCKESDMTEHADYISRNSLGHTYQSSSQSVSQFSHSVMSDSLNLVL